MGNLGALGACSLRREMACWSLALNLSFESESQCGRRSLSLCFICSHMRKASCSLRIWEGIVNVFKTLHYFDQLQSLQACGKCNFKKLFVSTEKDTVFISFLVFWCKMLDDCFVKYLYCVENHRQERLLSLGDGG